MQERDFQPIARPDGTWGIKDMSMPNTGYVLGNYATEAEARQSADYSTRYAREHCAVCGGLWRLGGHGRCVDG